MRKTVVIAMIFTMAAACTSYAADKEDSILQDSVSGLTSENDLASGNDMSASFDNAASSIQKMSDTFSDLTAGSVGSLSGNISNSSFDWGTQNLDTTAGSTIGTETEASSSANITEGTIETEAFGEWAKSQFGDSFSMDSLKEGLPDYASMSEEEIAESFGMSLNLMETKLDISGSSMEELKNELMEDINITDVQNTLRSLMGDGYRGYDTTIKGTGSSKSIEDTWASLKSDFESQGFGTLETELKQVETENYSSNLQSNLKEAFSDLPEEKDVESPSTVINAGSSLNTGTGVSIGTSGNISSSESGKSASTSTKNSAKSATNKSKKISSKK